jgi:hypothetical protein
MIPNFLLAVGALLAFDKKLREKDPREVHINTNGKEVETVSFQGFTIQKCNELMEKMVDQKEKDA